MTIILQDGRSHSIRTTAFSGTPEKPLAKADLLEKFLMLTHQFGGQEMARVFGRLQNLETEKTLHWIGA